MTRDQLGQALEEQGYTKAQAFDLNRALEVCVQAVRDEYAVAIGRPEIFERARRLFMSTLKRRTFARGGRRA